MRHWQHLNIETPSSFYVESIILFGFFWDRERVFRGGLLWLADVPLIDELERPSEAPPERHFSFEDVLALEGDDDPDGGDCERDGCGNVVADGFERPRVDFRDVHPENGLPEAWVNEGIDGEGERYSQRQNWQEGRP